MARDEVYDFAIANGEWLLHMMLASNYEAGQQLEPQHDTAQSAFISSEDLAKYGYTELPWDPVVGEGALDGLEPVFATIGANANMAKDGGKNVLADYKHTGACTINGIHYRATESYLTQICNTSDGVLIAYANQTAPRSAQFLHSPVLDIVPLHHWSDIAYLQWLKESTRVSPVALSVPAPINYILRHKIQNSRTSRILDHITGAHGHAGYSAWPGLTFDACSEEGKVILGTPNGVGVAWLLIQRKKELGKKRVEKITLFSAPSKGDYVFASLLFWIV